MTHTRRALVIFTSVLLLVASSHAVQISTAAEPKSRRLIKAIQPQQLPQIQQNQSNEHPVSVPAAPKSQQEREHEFFGDLEVTHTKEVPVTPADAPATVPVQAPPSDTQVPSVAQRFLQIPTTHGYRIPMLPSLPQMNHVVQPRDNMPHNWFSNKFEEMANRFRSGEIEEAMSKAHVPKMTEILQEDSTRQFVHRAANYMEHVIPGAGDMLEGTYEQEVLHHQYPMLHQTHVTSETGLDNELGGQSSSSDSSKSSSDSSKSSSSSSDSSKSSQSSQSSSQSSDSSSQSSTSSSNSSTSSSKSSDSSSNSSNSSSNSSNSSSSSSNSSNSCSDSSSNSSTDQGSSSSSLGASSVAPSVLGMIMGGEDAPPPEDK